MTDEPKLDLQQFMPPGWQGKYPPCQIRMDSDGQLWGEGRPMIHKGIIELIYESVHFDDGVYFLELDGKRCQLEVDDTFYVVTGVGQGEAGLTVVLNDGSTEALDPASLWVGAGDVMYCQVKGGSLPARFKRQAYYQLAEWIQEDGDGFALVVDGQRYELAVRA